MFDVIRVRVVISMNLYLSNVICCNCRLLKCKTGVIYFYVYFGVNDWLWNILVQKGLVVLHGTDY